MNAVNAVLLFILVWTFSAVCKADDDFSISCDDVTGSVGKEATFTCSVSLHNSKCCINLYKFQYPKLYNDSEIYKEKPHVNPCEQRNSFTCRYTPATAMTEQFRFFVQTVCGSDKTVFTVNITGPIKPEIDNEASVKYNKIISGTSPPDTEVDLGSKVSVITAVVGCFILLIIIIIVIRNKKSNFNNSCGFQNSIFLGIRHDEDNNNHSEDVINDSEV